MTAFSPPSMWKHLIDKGFRAGMAPRWVDVRQIEFGHRNKQENVKYSVFFSEKVAEISPKKNTENVKLDNL